MWIASIVLILGVLQRGWGFTPLLQPAAPSRITDLSATTASGGELSQATTSLVASDKSLKGCICLVTGSSRGIGKGIAMELGRQGATVYITGTSSSSTTSSPGTPYTSTNAESGPGTIEETAAQVTAAGGQGIAVACNHGLDDDVKELMERIERDHGRLDILINNCFRMPKGSVEALNKKFWEIDIDTWDNLHRVGLRSHYVASHFAMPLLLKSAKSPERPASLPRPLVGMIGSFGGLTYTFNLPYGVGKAAVDRLAKDMAIEVEEEDICVVSFWPGVVMTERTEISVESGDWEKFVGVPLDNAETPEFTGKAIIALAKDPENMAKSGSYQVVAELAQEYGFTDLNGTVPPSIRSLRFLLPSYAFSDEMREKIPSWMVPDWKIPFWIMAQGKPPAPEEK